jgi:hypothetical protein
MITLVEVLNDAIRNHRMDKSGIEFGSEVFSGIRRVDADFQSFSGTLRHNPSLNDVLGYLSGVELGFDGKQKPRLGDEHPDYKRNGHFVGETVKNTVRAKRQNAVIDVESDYYAGQEASLRDAIGLLRKQVSVYMGLNDVNPYQFFLDQMRHANGQEAQGAQNLEILGSLNTLFSRYEGLVQGILHGVLREEGITKMEKEPNTFERNIKLGVIYLFKGDGPAKATHALMEAYNQMSEMGDKLGPGYLGIRDALANLQETKVYTAMTSFVQPAFQKVQFFRV